MERKSWVCTLVTQLSLCLALFAVFNIGRPQKPIYPKRTERRSLDLYFITVRGGFRPLKEQTHLLKQVEKVLRKYNAKFVVDVSELGEKDPLMQNATRYFQLLKVPWYTTPLVKVTDFGVLHRSGPLFVFPKYITKALNRQGAGDYFFKQIKIPHGKTLDLIALDTGLLQDPSSGTGSDQLLWLTRILKASNSNWRIVFGFHPMVGCDKNIEQPETKQTVTLHHIFSKYGVNAYLSGQACRNLPHEGGIDITQINSAVSVDKRPYLTTINQRVDLHKEIVNGFLLHRVSSLEIVTYFVSLTGEVVHKIALQQQGKEAI